MRERNQEIGSFSFNADDRLSKFKPPAFSSPRPAKAQCAGRSNNQRYIFNS